LKKLLDAVDLLITRVDTVSGKLVTKTKTDADH